MKKILTMTLMVILLSAVDTIAQRVNKNNYLKIGDKIPEIVFSNVVGTDKRTLALNDYRGKFVILDMWATWCAPCRAAFPKLELLRKKFSKDLAIISVSNEPAQKIMDLFDALKKDGQPQYFSETQDTVMRKLFSFSLLPHYIWIDRDGNFIGESASDEINEDKIRSVINGSKSISARKVNVTRRVVKDGPIFSLGVNLNPDTQHDTLEVIEPSNLGFNISITRYRDGIGNITRYYKNGLSGINKTVENIYKVVLGRLAVGRTPEFSYFTPNSRIIWEKQDSSINEMTHKGLNKIQEDQLRRADWNRKHLYCVDFYGSDIIAEKAVFRNAQNVINDYFGDVYGINGQLEKRKVKCLILIRTSDKNKLATNGGNQFLQEGMYKWKMRNMPLSRFTMRLIAYYLQLHPLPFVDETGLKDIKVDIELNAKLSNVDEVNKELIKYDLKLVEEERIIDMIIMRQVQIGKKL